MEDKNTHPMWLDLELRNIALEFKDEKLIFAVDLTRNLGPSKSGKSINIASTPGIYHVGQYGFNLQVHRPLVKEKELAMPDVMFAQYEHGTEVLKAAGEKLNDWVVRPVKMPNGTLMDSMIRRKAWTLEQGL